MELEPWSHHTWSSSNGWVFNYLSHYISLLFKSSWAGLSVTCSRNHSNWYRRLGRKGHWGGRRNATKAYIRWEEVRRLRLSQIGKRICEFIPRQDNLSYSLINVHPFPLPLWVRVYCCPPTHTHTVLMWWWTIWSSLAYKMLTDCNASKILKCAGVAELGLLCFCHHHEKKVPPVAQWSNEDERQMEQIWIQPTA